MEEQLGEEIHQGSQGQVVKQVSERLPHVRVAVLTQALVVKPVNLNKRNQVVE